MTPPAGTLQAEIQVDTTRLTAALEKFSKSMEGVSRAMLDACQKMVVPFEGFLLAAEVAFHPDGQTVALAGQEGRYYVQGGMHPRYTHSPDALVQHVARLRALTPQHRATLMAAALRGWVTHHPGQADPVLAHHRAYGNTVVLVQKEARYDA